MRVEMQVLAALQFYATGSFQRMIGHSYDLLHSHQSALPTDITNALVNMAPAFIKFRDDQWTAMYNKLAFHTTAGFQRPTFPDIHHVKSGILKAKFRELIFLEGWSCSCHPKNWTEIEQAAWIYCIVLTFSYRKSVNCCCQHLQNCQTLAANDTWTEAPSENEQRVVINQDYDGSFIKHAELLVASKLQASTEERRCQFAADESSLTWCHALALPHHQDRTEFNGRNIIQSKIQRHLLQLSREGCCKRRHTDIPASSA